MSLNSNRLNTQYCHRNIRARSQAHFFFRRPGLGIGAGYVLPCAVQSHNNVVWRQSHFMTILSLLMICTCSSQSQTLRLQTRNRSSKFQTQIFFTRNRSSKSKSIDYFLLRDVPTSFHGIRIVDIAKCQLSSFAQISIG